MARPFNCRIAAGRLRATILLAALILAGCGAAAPQTPIPPTKVTVQLAWLHTIEYAGLHVAADRGLYQAENLEVTLQELGTASPIDVVLAGQATFGLSSADNLLVARAAGKPVVAIATIYQRSPVAFVSLKPQNITRPQDLVGKKVLVQQQGTTSIVYQALLKSQGIDPDQVTMVPRTDFSNSQLLSGEIDVMDAFINNQPLQLELEGRGVNSILASDYGIDIYANVIFTTQEVIDRQPELVTRFLRATLKGMQAELDDPESAARMTVARNSQLNFASEHQSLLRALPLINPAGSRPGMMTDASWGGALQVLVEQGVLKPGLDVKGAYSLIFLERIYGR